MYNAISPSSGSDYEKCRENVLEALNLNAKCEVKNCTFNGVWNGGGGAGQDKLYLTSAFYYTAADVSLYVWIDPRLILWLCCFILLENSKFIQNNAMGLSCASRQI